MRKIIFFLFISVSLYSYQSNELDKFGFYNLNRKVDIVMAIDDGSEKTCEFVKSDVFQVEHTDWIGEKHVYTAYSIRNIVLIGWLCINSNRVLFLMKSGATNDLVYINDIEFKIINNMIEINYNRVKIYFYIKRSDL